MSETHLARKVGLFVLIGIVLIAALMLNFSRGVGLFHPKYNINLRLKNVAGLKERSAVFFSGVQIGNVKSVKLDQPSKTVVVRLEILKEYPVRSDAKFVIEQIGFLGDQFVIIYPGTGEAPFLNDGDEVSGIEPFNLTEVARSTSDLLKRFDQLGAVVGEAINRVNNQVLDTNTLSNLSRTVANFQDVSERTRAVVDGIGLLVSSNAPEVAEAMTNLLAFSKKIDTLAGDLHETLLTNRQQLGASVRNMEETTTTLARLARETEAGKGVLGGLLHDDAMRLNIAQTVSNLTVLTSNLNRYGLLYKPKPPKPRKPIYTGKSEFR